MNLAVLCMLNSEMYIQNISIGQGFKDTGEFKCAI